MLTAPVAHIPIEPVSYETLGWTPRAPQLYSRAELARQTGDYAAAITPSIVDWQPVISSADNADVEDATRQLILFDRHSQLSLGAENSALGPMAAILLRTESASSSQIEQLTTSAKQLALAEIGAGDKENARTVVGNVRAMEAALDLAGEITEGSILAMHEALLRHQLGMEAFAGRYRDQQVWIGGSVAGPRAATFVPPHHERIRAAITDLIAFIARDDLPVLVQLAVAHAQFETIHPFVDGNGRTGRALAQSILRNKGLNSSTTVPISAGLLVDTERYFAALGAYRDGDAGPIVREFAAASRVAAVTGAQLVDELVAELARSRELLTGVRADATAWRVLPQLIAQPVVTSSFLMKQLGLGEMAALRALDTLTSHAVLSEQSGRARNRVWEHRGILAVLEGYAAGIRRMGVRSL